MWCGPEGLASVNSVTWRRSEQGTVRLTARRLRRRLMDPPRLKGSVRERCRFCEKAGCGGHIAEDLFKNASAKVPQNSTLQDKHGPPYSNKAHQT